MKFKKDGHKYLSVKYPFGVLMSASTSGYKCCMKKILPTVIEVPEYGLMYLGFFGSQLCTGAVQTSNDATLKAHTPRRTLT